MTIHGSDPFATPADQRSPARQFRGRLPSAVTLWTARHPDRGPAGLTVSSTQIVDGNPGRLLGLLDVESDLWEAVSAAGRFTVAPLTPADQQLADRFAGQLPSPGGLFRAGEWRTTSTNAPLPAHLRTWLDCRLDDGRTFGWSVLVEATILHVELGEPAAPLVHFRGRYRGLD
jgi:3-hydroxy-9,10-secoandrosta-1,3,5(10)-triene-9,17-dione monooxygenase reductase component